MTKAPERIWMDPDIKFPECEKQYECDVRAEMLKGQTMSDNTDDMNDFVLLAIARDEAVSRVKELEARVAAADKLAEACESVFDGIDATGPQEFYLALSAYQATKEGG